MLGPGKELEVSFEELGAAVAGFSNAVLGNIPLAIDAVSATLRQLLAPTTEAEKVLDDIFPEATNAALALREMIGQDGLIETLRFLRRELGDDTQALRRLLGGANAVLFAIDATGEKTADYAAALEANRNAMRSVNKGLKVFNTNGAFQAQQASNNLKLVLDKLYNDILIPLFNLFGKLHATIQTVVLGLGAMQLASTVGLAPSLSKLFGIINLLSIAWWRKAGAMVAARAASIAETIAIRAMIVQDKMAVAWRWLNIAATNALSLAFWRSTAALAASRIAMIAGTAATIAATVATTAFGIAMTIATGPIGLIVLGIAGLVAAGIALWKNWDAVKKKAMAVWDTIQSAFSSVLDWVRANWPLLAGILLGPFGIVGALVWKFRDDIVAAFQTAWRHVKDFFNRFGKYVGLALLVVAPFVGIPLLIARNWGQIVGIIGDVWSRVTDTVRGWINAIIALIKEFPGRVLDVMKNLPGQVLDAIPGGGALKAVGSFLGFQEGGIVPGTQGQAVPAVLHGGELVVPGRAVQSLHDFLSSIEAMRLPETTGQPQPAHQAVSVLSHLDMLFSALARCRPTAGRQSVPHAPG